MLAAAWRAPWCGWQAFITFSGSPILPSPHKLIILPLGVWGYLCLLHPHIQGRTPGLCQDLYPTVGKPNVLLSMALGLKCTGSTGRSGLSVCLPLLGLMSSMKQAGTRARQQLHVVANFWLWQSSVRHFSVYLIHYHQVQAPAGLQLLACCKSEEHFLLIMLPFCSSVCVRMMRAVMLFE